MLTAEEARRKTEANKKIKSEGQLKEILAGIDVATRSPHPQYYYVYFGHLEAEVEKKLKSLGYKILPPFYEKNEPSTQIEW